VNLFWRDLNNRLREDQVFRDSYIAAALEAAEWAAEHDYEPGEGSHPMHTDAACAICGRPRRDCEK
jgi:hypothetical protein